MNTETEIHDHYTSTDIDPACDLCQIVIAFRPFVEEEGRREDDADAR